MTRSATASRRNISPRSNSASSACPPRRCLSACGWPRSVSWPPGGWGIPLGLSIGAAGSLLRRQRDGLRLQALFWSLPLAIGVALTAAGCGLAYGYLRTRGFDPATYRGLWFPPGLADPRAFLCVGYMHNFAYAGGALAVPAAWILHFAIRRRSS